MVANICAGITCHRTAPDGMALRGCIRHLLSNEKTNCQPPAGEEEEGVGEKISRVGGYSDEPCHLFHSCLLSSPKASQQTIRASYGAPSVQKGGVKWVGG